MPALVVRYQRARHRLSGIGTALVLVDKHKHVQTDRQPAHSVNDHIADKPRRRLMPVVVKN